jgi:hypothetical protein
VHGAYPEFSAILQQTGLIDGKGKWTGRSATLIQPGDIPDRGHQSRACLDLFMNLEKQAGRQHGRVVFLLVNHEMMNMMGDLRYVATEECCNFAGPRPARVAEQNYEDYLKFVATQPIGRIKPLFQTWVSFHGFSAAFDKGYCIERARFGRKFPSGNAVSAGAGTCWHLPNAGTWAECHSLSLYPGTARNGQASAGSWFAWISTKSA